MNEWRIAIEIFSKAKWKPEQYQTVKFEPYRLYQRDVDIKALDPRLSCNDKPQMFLKGMFILSLHSWSRAHGAVDRIQLCRPIRRANEAQKQ